MKIVVPVKYVPEPTANWRFAEDLTLDRGAVEGRLSELDEYAIEQAVRLVEGGLDALFVRRVGRVAQLRAGERFRAFVVHGDLRGPGFRANVALGLRLGGSCETRARA